METTQTDEDFTVVAAKRLKQCTLCFHTPGGDVISCFEEKLKGGKTMLTDLELHFIINKIMTSYLSNVELIFKTGKFNV